MTDKDNRIRLDQTPVDFTESGTTGQNHDKYPKDQSRARYDQMRSFLIGLLANQSSENEPLEKRTGTTWFDKKVNLMKLFTLVDGSYIPKHLSNFIGINTGDEVDTLQSVLTSILASMNNVGPRLIWSGIFNNDEINQIHIPDEYQGYAAMSNMHPLVYVEGSLIDPRKTVVDDSGVYVKIIGGIDVSPRQEFTVILEIVTEIKQETVVSEG